jgi:FtsZ-interacting cell division protein YlmF
MADPGAVAGKKAQCDVVKKAAENPKLQTSALVQEFAAKTDDPSFRTRTVTVKSLERQIQRAKAKATFKPAAPKSFDDLETIPEEFKVD